MLDDQVEIIGKHFSTDLVTGTDLPSAERLHIPEHVRSIIEDLRSLSEVAERHPGILTADFGIGSVFKTHSDAGMLTGSETLSEYLNKYGGAQGIRVQLLSELLPPESLELFTLNASDAKSVMDKRKELLPPYAVTSNDIYYEPGRRFYLTTPTSIPNVLYSLDVTRADGSGAAVVHKEHLQIRKA